MSTLSIPLTHTPSYLLLALGLLKKVDVQFQHGATDESEPTYEGATGADQVRKALEEGLEGSQVSHMPSSIKAG
jgi:hypothetical protein